MDSLCVLRIGYDPPFVADLLTPIIHSEFGVELNLVIAYDFTPDVDLPHDDQLRLGVVEHHKGGRYNLLGRAYDYAAGQLGVWYRPIHRLGSKPHYFRPLHTPDGEGWLDPVNGEPRFRRIYPVPQVARLQNAPD